MKVKKIIKNEKTMKKNKERKKEESNQTKTNPPM